MLESDGGISEKNILFASGLKLMRQKDFEARVRARTRLSRLSC